MKSVSTTWAVLLSSAFCLAQAPAPPVPQEPPAPKIQKPAGAQTPPATQGTPVVTPNTPFESGAAPAPGLSTPGLSAAPTGSPGSGPPQPPGAATTDPAATTTLADGKMRKSYVIGPLDILDIRVWNDPKLSGIFDVRPDGVISMNLIGEIRADGLTVPELTKAIVAKLSDLMNAPEVNVQVARVNSKRYFIFGEVIKGGEFPLIADTTVIEALSNTGGFREFASPRKIYVLRGTKKLKFNYKEVSQGKHMEQNILLENGDKIFVP
jgi:polysaccharide export outer membrane protein